VDLAVSSICPKSGALTIAGRRKVPSALQSPESAVTGVTPGANGSDNSTQKKQLNQENRTLSRKS